MLLPLPYAPIYTTLVVIVRQICTLMCEGKSVSVASEFTLQHCTLSHDMTYIGLANGSVVYG